MIIGYRMRNWLALLIAFALATMTAQGQRALTLERCLALAEENSPALIVADRGADAVRLANLELDRSRLPQVTFHGDASYAPAVTGFGYDPTITSQGEIGARVQVQHLLYDGGQRDLQLRQGRLDIDLSG